MNNMRCPGTLCWYVEVQYVLKLSYEQGMQEIVSADPLVHDALVELLLPRMCHYFETDQSAQPIILDRCASLQVGKDKINPFTFHIGKLPCCGFNIMNAVAERRSALE